MPDVKNRSTFKRFRYAINDSNETYIKLYYECSHHVATLKDSKEAKKHEYTWPGFIWFLLKHTELQWYYG